ncbi:glycosyltransferase family 39 protein [Chloroflexus sp.]|uniref:glycosyltransferase family 39 protein n=1 Tax=Chloroflexus sp. TaxID=1904827 RepID=UPI00298F3922|nr:glycosyltransferase family 39 protein [Chloroflexus sp.]MDW8403790.1 glycosyltransferase family 39 protein [Chloroflexus sp.]
MEYTSNHSMTIAQPHRQWSNLTQTIRRPVVILGTLVAIGLALRLWFIAVNQIDPRFSAADDGDYYVRALRFAVTGEYLDNSWLVRPPGHIFFFAAMLRIGLWFGDPAIGIALIRAAQVILSLALIPLGYDLARRLFDQRTGYIFAAILAVWMPMVELPALILSEPLFLSMLLIHAWLLVRWRDDRRLGWLIGAGVTLALAALARSPGLYGALFAALFIAISAWQPLRRNRFQPVAAALLAFLLPFALTIAPWTIRNYVLYRDLILVDTLGPVNLWIATSDAVHEGRGEGEAKGILASLPQEERQRFVSAELRRIATTEPWRFTRNLWPHFQHIWKAQFVEDFFVKASFFTRPLREIWLPGIIGDLIWLITTLAAPFAFLARPREGAFRLLALGWIGYTCLMVMLIHVEPRYLLPVWLWFGLYGAAALARLGQQPWQVDRFALAGLAVSVFLAFLIFSYRDYPQIIRAGIAREQAWAAAQQALARGDAAATEQAYRAMLAADPDFADGQAEFARWLLAQGRYDEAWQVAGNYPAHRSNLVRGALARAQGDVQTATALLRDTEEKAGEDVQRLAFAWLAPAPTRSLTLGTDLDLGYLYGFAFGERAGDVTYRWLQGNGAIRLPLPEPLTGNETVALRLAAPAPTELAVIIGEQRYAILVAPGGWRVYYLPLPAQMRGQREVTVYLSAPTFLPYQRFPNSTDARPLSVMVQQVSIR